MGQHGGHHQSVTHGGHTPTLIIENIRAAMSYQLLLMMESYKQKIS